MIPVPMPLITLPDTIISCHGETKKEELSVTATERDGDAFVPIGESPTG